VGFIVVVWIDVDALDQRVQREQLSDGGELASVVCDALDAEADFERQHGRLSAG
jgi:hypothetical protein